MKFLARLSDKIRTRKQEVPNFWLSLRCTKPFETALIFNRLQLFLRQNGVQGFFRRKFQLKMVWF